MARPSRLLAPTPMASRLLACALLGVLLVAPTRAGAQSIGDYFRNTPAKLKRGDWQGAYTKQAEQRIDDGAIGRGNGYALEQAQNQAQAPAAAPGTPPGRVRIQGRDPNAPTTAIPPPAGLSVDPREQMRHFVQTISTFARKQQRDFQVITDGALDLLVKQDPLDETRIAPARAYMHAIDGVMVDGLYFDKKVFGEPTSDFKKAKKLRLANMARENGLRVMVIDYATDHKAIEESYVRNRQHGYISYVAPAPLDELNKLATYPPRPVGENPHSILSMSDVRNFAYIGDSTSFGRMDEYALDMHATNFDLLITNVFHGRDVLSKRAVETLKYKQIGARRMVFAIVDIGSAASYRYYWKPNWHEGSPAFIAAPFRDDPDRYYVQYWRPEWQRLIAGDNQSYIYGVIAQGFDGVVLRGMEESYRFFEGGDEQQQEEEQRQLQMRLKPQATTTPAPAKPAAPAPQPPATAAVPAPATPAAPAAPTTPTAPKPTAPGAPTPLTPTARP